MIRLGRYKIAFGRFFFSQLHGPTTVRCFPFFCVLKEARPTDVDRKPQFPLGTPMQLEGRSFRYYKAGGEHPEARVK